MTSYGPHTIHQQANSGILQNVLGGGLGIVRGARQRGKFVDGFAFAAHRLPARVETPSMTCSQPSRTRSVGASSKRSTRAGTTSSVWITRPNEAARAGATSGALPREPTSTKRTRLLKTECISWATATATVVLPMPPGPTIVTNLCAASFASIVAMVFFRPTMRAKRVGKAEREAPSSSTAGEDELIGTVNL